MSEGCTEEDLVLFCCPLFLPSLLHDWRWRGIEIYYHVPCYLFFLGGRGGRGPLSYT